MSNEKSAELPETEIDQGLIANAMMPAIAFKRAVNFLSSKLLVMIFPTFCVLAIIIPALYAYDITKETQAYRDTYCQNNVAYCTAYCGGAANAKINICSSSTLQWNCECIDPTKAPNAQATASEFPIQYYQCVGEKAECKTKCQTDNGVATDATSTCEAVQCDYKFACGSRTGGEQKSLKVTGSSLPNTTQNNNATASDKSPAAIVLAGMLSTVAIPMALLV